ncbi:C40 family peptidase, partial [Georgenia sp. SYP-B2076]|uniref:C40 family peptidase n=1 Tax=Georgenia sp. SYP-B2076 TaxID=2495881 RepID=UPI00197ADE12
PAPAPTTAPTAPSPAPVVTTPPAPRPAPSPAPAPKPAPAPVAPAPAPSGAGEVAIAWARQQIGTPYGWGAVGPDSYDCSGLTMRAFQQAGINLPRTSRAQYGAGSKVPVSQLAVGDLVFWSNNGSASGIYHVAIYTGGNMRLHAPRPGTPVQEVSMMSTGLMPYGVRV